MVRTASRSICIPTIDNPVVIATEQSYNLKLSKNRSCSTTSVSQASCPGSCPFLGHGCFTENHPQSIFTKLLNRSVITDIDQIARYEAYAIDQLSGRYPLRLHIVGDVTTKEGVRRLSDAAKRYTLRGDQVVWTYTHDWKNLPIDLWNGISVLASCQSLAEASEAYSLGYTPCIVVDHFKEGTHYELAPGVVGVPCPQETGRKESCVKCKLCWNTEMLRKKKLVILFHAHGSKKEKIKIVLRRKSGKHTA